MNVLLLFLRAQRLFLILYLLALKNLTQIKKSSAIAFAQRIVFSVVLLFTTTFSQAQLHADFVATPNSGCAPLVVKFSDFSSGNPSSWKWDLGNGTTSILHNPSVTYFNPGQYTIKLVVKNSTGSDSMIKSQFINVYASPQVNFVASSLSGCNPLPVEFTDSTRPGSGNIVAWEWDFGDGILSTYQSPSHTYTLAGKYNVSLRATNNFGCISSVTKPSLVEVYSDVKAAFTNTTPTSCNKPADVTFTNKSSGTGSLRYLWQFGDGDTSSLANPKHTYVIGTYTVSFIVFNANGCSDTIVKPGLISLGNVKANFSGPGVICQGSSASFVNTSNPTASSATWNFGDGTFSNAFNPVKIYSGTGLFNIKLVSFFGACKDSVIKHVQVVAAPQVDFSAVQTTSCKAPLTVTFKNNISGSGAYSWDFGDGNFSNLANPSHTYVAEGFYSVKLVFTNDGGCKDSIIKKDFIKIKSPVVSIPNLPQKGCAPLTNTFKANVNSIDSIISYVWDFGDSTTSSLLSPTHTYTKPGVYTVSLFYTTSSGCTDTVKVVNGILVGSKPAVNFSATPRDACASSTINFTDLSLGKPNEWLWLFDDGSSSTAKNPEHLYNDTGYFSTTLIAINNGCADTLVMPDYIHVKPPIAKFKSSSICNLPGHVTFTDESIGADSWKWDFGDGSSSTLQNPTHEYALSGLYVVSLTVINKSTGCDYTKINPVDVVKEIPDFSSSVDAVCKNDTVTFKAINSIPGNIASYTWRFGDGITSIVTSNSIRHSYKVAGIYSVTLILDIKNGCKDSIVKPLAIQVDGPTAVFKSINPGACLNSAVTFIDSSYANGSRTISSWQWNWGDGSTQTLYGPAFQHIYAKQGTYSVSLKVSDNNGCTDSIAYKNTIVISKPVASFKGDTLSCTSYSISFTNLSTGPGLTYLWDFGDGTTSPQLNPVHTYSNEGVYSVSLSIKDKYGCGDFISKTNYVRIANARANFTVSDTASSCPPLVVNFTNSSTNYSAYSWDFGDGTKSSIVNPSHFYATPGTFNAVLTTEGFGGCADIKSVQIKVKGPRGSFQYSNISGCKPLQTNFKATTEKNTTFVWDFSDGTTLVTPDSIVSHTYTNATAYLPKMILIDTAGCKVPVYGSDSVKVYEAFASFTNNSPTLCDSGKIAFNSTCTGNDIIADYLWKFGDNTTSTFANPIHNYIAAGNYTANLFIISKNGCRDSAVIAAPVKVVNSPRIAIGGNAGACTPASLTFTGLVTFPDTSSLKWKWDFANGNVSALQNPPAQNFLNAGFYSVSAIAVNSSGCSDTVVKITEAYALPVLKPTEDTTLCKGASLVLKANDANSYSWSPATYLSCINCASPVSNPDSAITYFVTGKSNKGCISKDSVSIDMKFPNTVKVGSADTLCYGSSVKLSAWGAETYSWSPAKDLNNNKIATPVATPGVTTNYKVVGSDTKGCFTSTAYVPVKVYPMPAVKAGEDKTINVGKSIEIIPQLSPDVTGIFWSPSTGVISRNYSGITVKPEQSIEYTILVKNEGGCFAEDKISVFVTCDNSNIFVPNTFSPNGDGVNDIFYPRGSGVFNIKNLIVFNRWGEVVFEKANFRANDASAGWDGTYKGKKLPPDVFVYSLQVLCANNQSLVFKGNVALVK